MVAIPLNPVVDVVRKFVIFYKLNPAFVVYEDGVCPDEALMKISEGFGIAPKFFEVVEVQKKHRHELC